MELETPRTAKPLPGFSDESSDDEQAGDFAVVLESELCPDYRHVFFCSVDAESKLAVAATQSRLDIFEISTGELDLLQRFEFYFPIRQVELLSFGFEIEILVVFEQRMAQIVRYSLQQRLLRNLFMFNGSRAARCPFRQGGIADTSPPFRYNECLLTS